MFKKTLLAAALSLFVPAIANAKDIDINTAEGMAKVMRKIQCSLEDSKPANVPRQYYRG